MSPKLHLDTHVVAWLYAGLIEELSERGRALIEQNELAISPAVLLELTVLHERGILRVSAETIAEDLSARIGLEVLTTPFDRLVRIAAGYAWAPSPFDRLICAEAQLMAAPLLTKDARLHAHFSQALW